MPLSTHSVSLANAASKKSLSRNVVILTREQVSLLLTMEECIDAVESAFKYYGEDAVAPPSVTATHVEQGGFHMKAGAMPYDGHLFYAAKANANFPQNPARNGLPTIQGAVLLFDAECGQLLAIMDSTAVTALRTGAATAVAAKYLADRGSTTATIVGCGVQGEVQASALMAVLPLRTVYFYDQDVARSSELATKMAVMHPATSIEVSNDLRTATRKSEIIVTCTTSTVPFLTQDHLQPGTFIAAVGADSESKQELDPHLLASSRVVPDIVQQAATIGELHHAIDANLLRADEIDTDLGRIVVGHRPRRNSAEETITFDSTGMALQDVAAACAVYRKAKTSGVGLMVRLNS